MGQNHLIILNGKMLCTLTSDAFSNCYADHGQANAAADTAAGGYNWVIV